MTALPTADGDFLHEGAPVRDLALTSDLEGKPTLLELGALRLCLIDRGGRLAIRTWDTAVSRHGPTFDGIDHWPVDPAWRVAARLEPTPGRTIEVPDVFGTIESEVSPGDLVFEVDGATHRLQALPGGDAGELWLVFGDATNGIETYGGGRYLYTDPPDRDGAFVLDFNRGVQPAVRLLAVRHLSAALAGEPSADSGRGRGANVPGLLIRRVRPRDAARRGRGRARSSAARRR